MSDEITIPAPPLTWARIDASRVAEVITLPDGEQPSEPGDWQDCTDVQPQPVVGMAYADGVYSLPRWALIVDGQVTNVVEQIPSPGDGWQDCTGQHVGPGSGFAGDEFTAPAASPRHITVLAFRNRFTQSEKIAIEIAALDNPAAAMPQRAQSAALRANQLDVQAANYIDLDRTDTRAGVQVLEAATILAAGRALEILDAPIAAHEEYHP